MQTNTNPIQAFAFDSHAVRVVQISGHPWFVARDVCSALCIGNNRMALERLDDDEKGVSSIDTLGGPQELTIINESGLYSLILGSRKPEAKKFKKWVTAEVLPSIRQTGSYTTAGADTALNAKIDKLLDLMEQMLKVIPKLLEAARPSSRRGIARKKMYTEDVERILALRAKGYLLDELVAETDFSQSQCWSVLVGRYKVLESGRVSIDLRSDAVRAAEAAAKAQRASGETV